VTQRPVAASAVRLKFLLPSVAGVIIFAVPVIDSQRQTIVYSLLTDALGSLLAPVLVDLLFGLTAVSALGALLGRRFQRWFRLPGRSAVDMSASLVSACCRG